MTDDTTAETIRFTADVVLLAAGHVLLIQRGWEPYAGCWALPGGHVDAKEASLAAGARELKEETGIVVPAADLRQVGVFDAPDRDPRGRYVTVAYTATLHTLVPPTAGDDATAALWWPLGALPDLAFDHAEILASATDADGPTSVSLRARTVRSDPSAPRVMTAGQQLALASEFRVPLPQGSAGGYAEVVVQQGLPGDAWGVTDGALTGLRAWIDGEGWRRVSDVGRGAAFGRGREEALLVAHQVAELEAACYQAQIAAGQPEEDSGRPDGPPS
ncbi:NUDIX domain-containing protein [Streptomyces sp. NPDC055912]|uniref:NUDIX domain-containing protein n=1 Tax=Streptomyces sp. NPDC055912 TaxID=3345660 RepID=UPI0035E1D22B